MNKSLFTNLVAVALIVVGYALKIYEIPGSAQVLTVGFFALSGAITNWLAIFMLFEKVPGIYGSGVVPVHFESFKTGIKDMVATQFLDNDNFEKFTASTGDYFVNNINLDSVQSLIDGDKIFDGFQDMILQSKFGSMLGMFGGAGAIEGFREPSIQKMQLAIADTINSSDFSSNISNAILSPEMTTEIRDRLESMIEERLEEMTPKMVKEIIQDMIKTHLGWLVVWGGVFGGIIGLVMSFVPA